MDTTPKPVNPEPDRQDNAPPWALLVVVVAVVLGGLWLLWSFFNFSGY